MSWLWRKIPVVTNCLVGSSLQLGCGFPTSQVQEMPETDVDERFQIQSFYINRKVWRIFFGVYWKNILRGEGIFPQLIAIGSLFLGEERCRNTEPEGLYGSFRRYGPTSCLTIVAETTEIVQSAWVFDWEGWGLEDILFNHSGMQKSVGNKVHSLFGCLELWIFLFVSFWWFLLGWLKLLGF